jgi:hypothetical protein
VRGPVAVDLFDDQLLALEAGEVSLGHVWILSIGQPPRVSASRWARVRLGILSWPPTRTDGSAPLRSKR